MHFFALIVHFKVRTGPISTNAWQMGVKKKKVNASSLWPAADAFGTPPPPFRSPGLPECCDSVRLDVFQ